MKTKALLPTLSLVALFAIAGCTPSAREDLDQAGDKVGSATEKSAQGTAEAVGNAGEAVSGAAKEAGQEVQEGAQKAGQAVEQGAENVGEAVGGAVQGAAKETQDAGQAMTLTPKVKNALVADKRINASTIDVDTDAENDTVVIKGTVPSAAAKTRATAVATKALKDSGSNFKVRNELKVGKGT